MKALFLALTALAFASCANTQTAERTPVPPRGSDHTSIPWNDPGQGPVPGGMLGGMMEGR